MLLEGYSFFKRKTISTGACTAVGTVNPCFRFIAAGQVKWGSLGLPEMLIFHIKHMCKGGNSNMDLHLHSEVVQSSSDSTMYLFCSIQSALRKYLMACLHVHVRFPGILRG